jgi:hypothetical protein
MPTIFKHGNIELKKLMHMPCLENLVAYFDVRTAEWIEPFKDMECITVGVFYDLEQSLKGSAAFEMLNIASFMTTEHMPDKKFMRFVDLLSVLADNTNTNEMPSQLKQIWDSILERTNKIELESIGLESLKKYYRIAG